MITKEKWEKGQKIEREFHDQMDTVEGTEHYSDTYEQYFMYLDIDTDLKGKSIIEIGPADFPGLSYCASRGVCIVIEPMPSERLEDICALKGLVLVNEIAEEFDFPEVDEVWMFNVLQHVISPDKIITKAKHSADVIRFFEPINAGIDVCHHHEFTLDYFKGHFGDCVKHYEKNDTAVNFHKWECAYGVWKKEI